MLQHELSNLESQYLAVLQKQIFLNSLREDKWTNEEDIENMSTLLLHQTSDVTDREIRSRKRNREEQEIDNKEVLQTISNGIHQIIENQQTAKALRATNQSELQEVKKQVC